MYISHFLCSLRRLSEIHITIVSVYMLLLIFVSWPWPPSASAFRILGLRSRSGSELWRVQKVVALVHLSMEAEHWTQALQEALQWSAERSSDSSDTEDWERALYGRKRLQLRKSAPRHWSPKKHKTFF